jgi:hypothetical protein
MKKIGRWPSEVRRQVAGMDWHPGFARPQTYSSRTWDSKMWLLSLGEVKAPAEWGFYRGTAEGLRYIVHVPLRWSGLFPKPNHQVRTVCTSPVRGFDRRALWHRSRVNAYDHLFKKLKQQCLRFLVWPDVYILA